MCGEEELLAEAGGSSSANGLEIEADSELDVRLDMHPASKGDQRHPGLYHHVHSQYLEGSDRLQLLCPAVGLFMEKFGISWSTFSRGPQYGWEGQSTCSVWRFRGDRACSDGKRGAEDTGILQLGPRSSQPEPAGELLGWSQALHSGAWWEGTSFNKRASNWV